MGPVAAHAVNMIVVLTRDAPTNWVRKTVAHI
jgi:hypothetical protein